MGQWRASADIPATVDGPVTARHVADALITGWGLGHLSDDVQIVVSELVTNAYQHAPGTESFELELVAGDSMLRICLADGSSIRPVIADLEAKRPRGRGMRIVATVATRWGADDHNGGKRVWVDLAIDRDPAARRRD